MSLLPVSQSLPQITLPEKGAPKSTGRVPPPPIFIDLPFLKEASSLGLKFVPGQTMSRHGLQVTSLQSKLSYGIADGNAGQFFKKRGVGGGRGEDGAIHRFLSPVENPGFMLIPKSNTLKAFWPRTLKAA